MSINGIVARRVATACASVPIRLYAPSKGGARSMTRARKRYLTDAVNGPGRKAAQAAQEAGDFEEIDEHPILDLLSDPSGYEIGMTSAEVRFLNRMLCGNSYTLKSRPSRGAPPEALFDLCPAWVQIVPSKSDFIAGYRYGRDQQAAQQFGPEEIIHGVEYRDPQTPYRGVGVVSMIIGEHQLYLAVTQKQLALMDNQGRPDYVLSMDTWPTDDQKKQLRQSIEALTRGASKSGNFLILPKTANVVPLTFPPKDMGEIETQRYLASVIAAAYGVPETEVFMNSANLASAQVGQVQMSRLAVLPRLQKDAALLTERLVIDYPDLVRRGAWLAYDNPVPEDEQQKSATLSMLVDRVLTVDECRAELGYEPLPNGEGATLRKPGDFARQPADDTPSNTTPDTETGDDKDDGEPGEPEPGKSACCGACPQRRSYRSEAAAVHTAWVKSQPSLRPDGDQNEPLDTRWYRSIVAEFRSQERSVLSRMDANPFGLGVRSISKASLDEALIRQILEAWGISDPRQWDQSFFDHTGKYVTEAVNVGAYAGLSDARAEGWRQTSPDSFYVSSEPVVKAANARADSYQATIRDVDDQTAERLRTAIVDGLRNGDGLSKLKDAVREAFNAPGASGVPISEARAATIARTESARAQNDGRKAGWKATEAVTGKRFAVSPGSCQFCEAIASEYGDKPIPLDSWFVPLGKVIAGADGGTYVNDYEDTDNPHPNCRCSVRPALISEEA